MVDPYLSAAEQMELVRIRAVTVRELITAYLDRSEAAQRRATGASARRG